MACYSLLVFSSALPYSYCRLIEVRCAIGSSRETAWVDDLEEEGQSPKSNEAGLSLGWLLREDLFNCHLVSDKMERYLTDCNYFSSLEIGESVAFTDFFWSIV